MRQFEQQFSTVAMTYRNMVSGGATPREAYILLVRHFPDAIRAK